ncbi:MAG: GTP pyrophosphokinase family protein [Lachnospirales bacterium]
MDIINWNEFLFPYRQSVDELVTKLNGLSRKFIIKGAHSPIEEVQGRVKKIASILEKAQRKGIPYEDIAVGVEDIAGIRILCKFEDDIWQVVNLIKSRENYDIKVLQERDYITSMKESGYKSYHMLIDYTLMTTEGPTAVRAEIQIRTLAMNFWATIEHSLNYKYSHNIPDHVKKRLINVAEASYDLDRQMSEIREEILETIEIQKKRDSLVDEILSRIEALYYKAKVENANELNHQFFQIYEKGDINELVKFSEKLELIAKLYKEA